MARMGGDAGQAPEKLRSEVEQARQKLGFEDFSELVKQRDGITDLDMLKTLFDSFDADKSGTIDRLEYLEYSLVDAMRHSHKRLVEMWNDWDHDDTGALTMTDFRRGVELCGYDVDKACSEKLFKRIDADNTGTIEYKELRALLDKAEIGLMRTLQHLMETAPQQKTSYNEVGIRELGSKAKDVNRNFVAERVMALPSSTKLVHSDDQSVEEQLALALVVGGQPIIRLFRNWDEDGNGGISKKELQQGLSSVHYTANKKEIDELFSRLSGGEMYIEFEHFSKALKKYMHSAMNPGSSRPKSKLTLDAEAGKKYSLEEFSALVKAREGIADDATIKALFQSFAAEGSDTIDLVEYLEFTVEEIIYDTHVRLIDLLNEWDENNDHFIQETEFCHAVEMLGVEVPRCVSTKLFARLDSAKTGKLEYKQLKTMVKKGHLGVVKTEQHLKDGEELQKHNARGAALEAKEANKNFVPARVQALTREMVELTANDDHSVEEQLAAALMLNNKTVKELFQSWDVNGDGGISKKEFRKAVAALGYKPPDKKDIDKLFDKLAQGEEEPDYINYHELKLALQRYMRRASAKKLPKPPSGPRPVDASPKKPA